MAELQIDVKGNATVTLKGITEESKKADEATKELKESVGALGSVMQRVKDTAADALIDSLKEFVRTIPQGAIATERHEQALRALGPAYQEVQRATNGVVSAEQAWQVQQKLAQANIRVSSQELAAITARAREYARTTGTDLNQALGQLSDQMRDGGDGLRVFGITIEAGRTKTENFNRALAQLVAQQQGAIPSTVSTAEAQDRYNRSIEQAKNNLQSFLAEKVGLRDFFEATAGWLEDVTRGSQSWGDAMKEAIRGTLAEASNGSGFERGVVQAVFGPVGAEIIRRYGRQQPPGAAPRAAPPPRADMTFTASDAANDSRQLATEEARAAAAARRQQVQRELAAQIAPVDADAVRRARLEYEAAQREAQAAGAGGMLGASARAQTPEEVRQQRLDVLRRGATETDGRRGENEVARLQRVTAATREYIAALRQYRDEDERVAEQLRASAEAEVTRRRELEESNRAMVDVTRREREERLASLDEERQINRERDAAERPGARGDAQRQQDRLRELGELRGAYQELLAQTDARLAQARAEGRDVGEVNTLMQERLGLLRSLSGATQELIAIQREQSAATGAFKDSMVSALGGVADAFGAAAVAALDGEKSFGEAVGGMLREQAKALAKQAVMETLKNSALAVFNLAIGNIPAATNHGIAAGLWAAVGVAAGVTVAATRPSTAGASGGAGAGRSSAGVERAARPETGGGGPLNLSINISGAVFSDDGITEAVSRGVRRAAATGRLPTRILRE